MLRIKKEVDLTELLDLGFKYNDCRGKYLYLEKKGSRDCSLMEINSWNGVINIITTSPKFRKVEVMLFNLISNGWVEDVNQIIIPEDNIGKDIEDEPVEELPEDNHQGIEVPEITE